jgi:hypothetical protein
LKDPTPLKTVPLKYEDAGVKSTGVEEATTSRVKIMPRIHCPAETTEVDLFGPEAGSMVMLSVNTAPKGREKGSGP